MKKEIIKIDVGEISIKSAMIILDTMKNPPNGESERLPKLFSCLSSRELELFASELSHKI